MQEARGEAGTKINKNVRTWKKSLPKPVTSIINLSKVKQTFKRQINKNKNILVYV